MAALCRAVRISTSGYYARRKREPSERQKQNQALLSQIRQFFVRSKQTYGSPRIWKDLQEARISCSFTLA